MYEGFRIAIIRIANNYETVSVLIYCNYNIFVFCNAIKFYYFEHKIFTIFFTF